MNLGVLPLDQLSVVPDFLRRFHGHRRSPLPHFMPDLSGFVWNEQNYSIAVRVPRAAQARH
jgi:hypothetical protein